MSKMIMLSLVALIASSAMAANTYYVATSGSDSADGSESAPFATVTKAIAAAVAGDTIIVDDGTYTAPNAANGFDIKAITLKSKNGALKTILKGGGDHRVLTMNEGAYVEGFSITGGVEKQKATDLPGYGGGVVVRNSTLKNCIVHGNKATTGDTFGGGGIMMAGGGLISGCVVSNNIASATGSKGGGVRMHAGVMENSLIVDNKSVAIGGGVYLQTYATDPAIVRNCTIVKNSVDTTNGGGLYLFREASQPFPLFYDSIVYGTENSVDVALGVKNASGEKHTIAEWKNYIDNLCSSVEYGEGWLQASKEMFSDWQKGDYMPVAESCLVDAAFGEVSISEVDVDGNDRLVGSRMDIGAIEFQNKYKLTISSRYNDRGTVSIDGEDGNSIFVNSGEEVKVVASSLGDAPFAGWTLVKGAHFDKTLLSSQELTFTPNCNVELVANFVREFEVSKLESLQSAIKEAYPGDVIIVDDGEYVVPNENNGLVVEKAITIKSKNGPEKTILKGGGEHRVITLKNSAWVEGFTITGGKETFNDPTYTGYGSGVCIENSTLVNCIVSGNTCESPSLKWGGGAVFLINSGLVSGCVISNNAAKGRTDGAGVAILGGILENSLIANCTCHTSDKAGGGIYAEGRAEVIIRNCTVVKNTAPTGKGGGIYVNKNTAGGSNIPVRIIDTIVYGNQGGNVSLLSASYANIVNLCSTTSSGTGFITGSDSIFADYAGGDYALAAGSVCIDAASGEGTAIDRDVAGNPRVQGSGMDVGAYEFVPKVGTLTVQYDNSVIQSAQVSPAFGRIENILQDIDFTASEGYYTANNEDYYAITGWEYVIYDVNGAVISTQAGDGRNASLRCDPKNAEILFKWKTTKYYKVTANPSKEERGNVTINNSEVNTLYVLPGQEITVAVESEGVASFGGWYVAKKGILTEAQFSSMSVTFSVNCSADLVAKFPVEFCVSQNGSDENDGLSWNNPFASLTNAIEVAGIGDIITVGDGEYEAPDKPDGIKVIMPIIVKSQNGPKKTILKGGGNNRVVTMAKNARVEGFTITGGNEKNSATIYPGEGGGVCVYNSTLVNCIVTGNKSNNRRYGGGAGVVMYGESLVSGCIISNNEANNTESEGGGVRMFTGILENSLITGNVAKYRGGGVFVCKAGSNPVIIRNCTVVKNENNTNQGNGIYVKKNDDNAQFRLIDSIVYGNFSNDSSHNDIVLYQPGQYSIVNTCTPTILYNLKDLVYSEYFKNGKEDSTLKTLLTGDPKFKDYENGDFRLAAGSPCINNAYGEAATKTDLAGKKRVIGKAMDIGCYEFSSGFSVVVR